MHTRLSYAVQGLLNLSSSLHPKGLHEALFYSYRLPSSDHGLRHSHKQQPLKVPHDVPSTRLYLCYPDSELSPSSQTATFLVPWKASKELPLHTRGESGKQSSRPGVKWHCHLPCFARTTRLHLKQRHCDPKLAQEIHNKIAEAKDSSTDVA